MVQIEADLRMIDGVSITVINTQKRRKKARRCIYQELRKAGVKEACAKWMVQDLLKRLRLGQQFYGILAWNICGKRTQKRLRRGKA